MMLRRTSWLIGLLIGFNVHAQEFNYQAEVPAVTSRGYYSLVLSPQLLGKQGGDLADLRLLNDQNQEVPYLLRKERDVAVTSLYKEYEIIEKAYKKDAISHLIFSNPDKKAIDNISFLVKNTDVQKRARLSGSDDKQNWYVIKNNYLLHSMKSEDETTELKILNFPLSDYAYFKLEIDDNWRLPINILGVGYYDTEKVKGLSTTFDWTITEQKDSLKTTYVRLDLPDTTYLENLKVEVSGAEYYSRYTKVMVKREYVNRKKRKVESLEFVGSFELNSNSPNKVSLRGLSTKTLYLEIDNQDNPPLKVERVTGSMLNQYLIAELKEGEKYALAFGNEKLRSPQYDLVKFADQIPDDLPKLKPLEITDIRPISTEKPAGGLWTNPYLIWVVIGVVGLVLAYISVKMIKEMG